MSVTKALKHAALYCKYKLNLVVCISSFQQCLKQSKPLITSWFILIYDIIYLGSDCNIVICVFTYDKIIDDDSATSIVGLQRFSFSPLFIFSQLSILC